MVLIKSKYQNISLNVVGSTILFAAFKCFFKQIFFCRLHLEVSIFFHKIKKTLENFLNQIGLKFLCIMHAHHI